jgi:hypothetical protein
MGPGSDPLLIRRSGGRESCFVCIVKRWCMSQRQESLYLLSQETLQEFFVRYSLEVLDRSIKNHLVDALVAPSYAIVRLFALTFPRGNHYPHLNKEGPRVRPDPLALKNPL